MIDAQSPKYSIIDEGNVRKLIIKKCTTEDIAEYTAVVANVKTSSRLKVESKFDFIFTSHVHFYTFKCMYIMCTYIISNYFSYRKTA